MVRRARRYVLLAYGLNLILVALLGAVVFDALKTSLGSSLSGEQMRTDWDARWYEGFSVQAQGVASTFRPSVAGAGGVFDALDAFAEGFSTLLARGTGTGIVPVAVTYLLAWSFLGGALLGTFSAHPSGGAFLQRGAHWFPRLLPLTLAGLAFYAIVLGPVHARLDDTVEGALRGLIDERWHVAAMLIAHACLWSLVALGNLVLDYAKVLRVLGDVSGPAAAVRAVATAARLVWRHPTATIGLYVSTALLGLAALLTYVMAVPGAADGAGSALAFAGTFLFGQLFVLSRIALRAVFLAGEVVVATDALAAARHGTADQSVPAA
jgi:hypothetical protein